MVLPMIILWPEKGNNKIVEIKLENGREQSLGMGIGITDELQWRELHPPLATREKGHGYSQRTKQGDLMSHREE